MARGNWHCGVKTQNTSGSLGYYIPCWRIFLHLPHRQALMLGVVYTRFSAPSRHSVSIRFSRILSMYQVG